MVFCKPERFNAIVFLASLMGVTVNQNFQRTVTMKNNIS